MKPVEDSNQYGRVRRLRKHLRTLEPHLSFQDIVEEVIVLARLRVIYLSVQRGQNILVVIWISSNRPDCTNTSPPPCHHEPHRTTATDKAREVCGHLRLQSMAR